MRINAMNNIHSPRRLSFKKLCIVIAFSFMVASVSVSCAGDLFIDPSAPFVELGGKVSLSVTNANGSVKWKAFKGEIEQTGNVVTYKAPDKVTVDGVSAMDSAGNIGTIKITVQEKKYIDELFSRENANWEIFTNRSYIFSIILSDDGTTLWVGTIGGLEERNAHTGALKRVYINQDGLPDNWVFSLASDGQGGLWVGTWGGGLAHHLSDGTWEVFDEESSDLPDNWVSSLQSDNQGGLWVGTKEGGFAHRLSDGTWEVFDEDNSDLSDNYVLSLLSDGKGGIWVGTSGGLTHRLSDGRWEMFDEDNSDLPDNYPRSLLSDGQGGLWVGTYGGLAHRLSEGTWEVFDEENSDLPDNWVSSLQSDNQGGIWVGTSGGLAHRLSDGTWEVFDEDNSDLPDNLVWSLQSNGQGGLWVGTFRDGLVHRLSDGTWEVFDNSDLPEKDVASLQFDGQGGLWVGTSGGLAHRLSDGSWEVFDEENSDLPDNDVLSLLSDVQGGIWVGTWDGLAHRLSDGSWEVFDKDNSDLPDNDVDSLLSDGQGGIWVGTGDGLAHLLSDGSWEVLDEENSDLPDNDVQSLLSDVQGGIWVGTWDGLAHRLSDGSWEVFDEDNSALPDNSVWSLLSDGQGGIWVGTWGGGLAHRLSDGSWEVFDEDNSDLPDNYVGSLLSDGQGGLWVGTWGGGLAHRLSDGIWEVFDEDNSDLPDNDVQSLLSDGQGGLWVGTGLGGLAHLTYHSGTIDDEQYLTGNRAAIIIAGGGNTDDNILWDTTQSICNYTYKMLNRRGFLNTDIHYISPHPFADFDGDGLNDRIVDAPKPARQLTLADIQDAFDWAKTKRELNQPLYIFFTDHGGDNRLLLSWGDVYLEAAELNTMLDDYQQATGNKVILVIDACHSGTLVESLAAPGRAIISSTDDGLAYFDRYDDQSFSYFVTKGLFKGMNFAEAFDYATNLQKRLLGKLSEYATVAGDEAGSFSQEPQYDDNGDGFYSSDEGEWLKQVAINGSVTIGDITLQVTPLIDSGMVSGLNSTQIPLKAEASLSAGKVERVWSVIRPPQMDILVDDTGIPLLAFPKTDMTASKTEENAWEGSYDGFIYNGEYEVTFYAQDNEGNIESSDSIKLTVADGMVCPPKASLAVNAEKAIYQTGEALTISVTEHLAYGYDLYVALFLPDGQFMALKSPIKDSNGLQQLEYNQIYWGDRWMDMHRDMGRSVNVIDTLLPQEKLSAGQYCLYAALIPQGQDLINAVGKGFFVLDGVCFEIMD
ncbi:Two-component system sensor histidine kinase/response regulator [Desulfamplus magnetovallimortis]|uniref:Two-component system sensor histidine kinase/response regulator n=1 Tax=Desulfamplus magnetovallimortis TaxID=1246637 RepID=A0A1W1HDV0_9BACT|nr:two-component regulator propeller domain-containing protein [Desulfamplus magnetovallimortis]SLM30674.1 Two-component system sensor histidine kinase/response regulator [Desulfamplus magnetovallimortis]